MVDTTIDSARDRLLARLFRFTALAGIVAYVPGVMAGVEEGLWAIVVIDTVAYVLVAIMAFLPSLRPGARLAAFVAGCLAVGSVVLFTTGPLGAGYLWLLFAMVISALFGRPRAIGLTVLASMAVMALWALILARGGDGKGASPRIVAIIAASLLVIGLALTMIIRRLFDDLSVALGERGRLADSMALELRASMATRDALEEALAGKDELLRELQHRVRNNLQTIMSLLALEGDDGGQAGLDRARRRVRALAVANDHFLSRPDSGMHDAWFLVRAVAQALGVRATFSTRAGSPTEPLLIDAHAAPVLAIMASDILAGLDRLGPVTVQADADWAGAKGEAFMDFRVAIEAGVAEPGIALVLEELASDRIARSAASELNASAAPGGAGVRLVLKGLGGASS